jgi:hypothetical protein
MGKMCGGIWEVQRKRGAYRVIWGDLSERSHLEELGIDKTKLLKLIFKK